MTVGEALVRYVNQGVTLGSVNLPEINLRSLTLDEPNHARVSIEPWTFSSKLISKRLSTSITMFRVCLEKVSSRTSFENTDRH